MLSVTEPSHSEARELEVVDDLSFERGIESLRRVSMDNSVYPMARILWKMWSTHRPARSRFWLLAVTEDYRLAGIWINADSNDRNWRNYHAIDPVASFDETSLVRISEESIGFGNDGRPCFWGLYQYLRKVKAHLTRSRKPKVSES